MEDCLGRVEEGCIADLITVNMMRPHIFPTNNRTTAVLDTVTAQDVEDSIIDGKLIMEHRILKTIDEAAERVCRTDAVHQSPVSVRRHLHGIIQGFSIIGIHRYWSL